MPKLTDLVEIKTMLAQRIPQWIKEGEQRGEARGEAKTLLKQLEFKFGPLPEWVERKINSAEKDQLDCWVERIITSETLDEVFA